MSGYLLVRALGLAYGLQLDQVREVIDGFELYEAPGVSPAVRGVTPIRARLVPLVHLGALLTNEAPPAQRGQTAVLSECGRAVIAFEVDDADAVVRGPHLPVPSGWRLPWVVGVASHDGTLIPIIDVAALVERLVPAGVGARS